MVAVCCGYEAGKRRELDDGVDVRLDVTVVGKNTHITGKNTHITKAACVTKSVLLNSQSAPIFALQVHKALRLPRNLHFKVHKRCACHRSITSRFTKC